MKEHKGAEVVGVTGFCWGGMIAMKAASLGADAEGGVKAGGNVHPAMLSAELAEDVSRAETYLLYCRSSVKSILRYLQGDIGSWKQGESS